MICHWQFCKENFKVWSWFDIWPFRIVWQVLLNCCFSCNISFSRSNPIHLFKIGGESSKPVNIVEAFSRSWKLPSCGERSYFILTRFYIKVNQFIISCGKSVRFWKWTHIMDQVEFHGLEQHTVKRIMIWSSL